MLAVIYQKNKKCYTGRRPTAILLLYSGLGLTVNKIYDTKIRYSGVSRETI
jgi:hypothetical protein